MRHFTEIEGTREIGGEDAKRFRHDLYKSLTKKLTLEEQRAKEADRREREECYKTMVSISHGTFR
ncbi:hypothetical protein Barb4_02790 [Bacteroidales bacterium Barb4]|nr:hypothetical protein Barb4_02790 [Bacteroidales bacterium Barb4]